MKNKKSLFNQIVDVAFPVLIYYLASVAFMVGVNAIIVQIVTGKEGGDLFINEHYAAINATSNGIGMLIAGLLVLRHFLKENMYGGEDTYISVFRSMSPCVKTGLDKLKKNGKSYLPIWLVVLCASLFFNIVISYITTYTGEGGYEAVKSAQYSVSPLLAVLLYGIISPFAEEVIYRGIVLKKVARYISPIWGILLSAFLFGLFHGNLVQGIYAFLMGLIFAYYYVETNAFCVPLIAHAIANLLVYCLSAYGLMGKNFAADLIMMALSGLVGSFLLVRRR